MSDPRFAAYAGMPWEIGCNGPGRLQWFAHRGMYPQQVLSDARGRYRRFATREAATRAAVKASADEKTAL